MKKNLLFMLFMVLTGLFTAKADVINFNVDKAANIIVTYGPNDTRLTDLWDGYTRVTSLTSADNPLAIKAAEGAEILSVKVDGQAKYPAGDGLYRLSIVNNMTVFVETSGDAGGDKMFNTMFDLNAEGIGHLNVSYDDTSVIIDQEWQTLPLPSKPITLQATSGYSISSVSYTPDYVNNEAVDNGDGTWSFTPTVEGKAVSVRVVEDGVPFNVEVNYGGNIGILARMTEDINGETKVLTMLGNGPYTAVAPKDCYAIEFMPVEGAEIKGITRVTAIGKREEITYSDYSGWRAFVSEGDTYIIDVVGPEVILTPSCNINEENITLDRYVISVNGTAATFDVEDPKIKAHAGDIVTVGGGRGVEVMTISTDAGDMIQAVGPVASFKITRDGYLFIQGQAITDITINVDNAAAVIVRDQNGYGSQLNLVDGNNVLTDVRNPLNITAAPGYLVQMVVLDGTVLKPNADGSYTAEIIEGSTLAITTAVKPAAYPVTIALAGDFSWLNVAVEGEPVTVTAEESAIMVEPGSTMTFSPVKGYLINTLTTSSSVLYAEYDEDTKVWSVIVNGAGLVDIHMEKWVPSANNVLIDYSRTDAFRTAANVTDQDGNYVMKLEEGLNEVAIGNFINISTANREYYIDEVLYNGVNMNKEEYSKECSFEVTEAGTVTASLKYEKVVYISGYTTGDEVNHANIGYIYINEVGQDTYYAKPGETITLLPTPAPGYIFDGFEVVFPLESAEAILKLIPTEAPYTLTIPDDIPSLAIKGNFIVDEEHPSYVVHTYACYVDGQTDEYISPEAFVMLLSPTGEPINELVLLEGSEVQLLCYVKDETFYPQYFCLLTDPTRKLPNVYTVDGNDANSEGVIEISAYVITEDNAVESVDAESFRYDAASATLYAPEAGTVYTLGGQAVKGVEAGANDLSGLASGIYVVVTPAGTLKIAK